MHTGLRWLVFAGLMALYCMRVFFLNGWFIVTYGLGIYLLNNFIGFLSPQVKWKILWICRRHGWSHLLFVTEGLDMNGPMSRHDDLIGCIVGRSGLSYARVQ